MSVFSEGFVFGVSLTVLVFMTFWHINENRCEKAHNVHDCVFAGFEPREVENNP